MEFAKLIASVLLPVLIYCLLMWMIAALGGWAALAKRYRSNHSNLGETFRMRSAKIGMISYGNCLTMSVSPAGLQISVWTFFRFAHPPLLIPWTEFHQVRERRLLFLFPIFEATIGNPAIAYLRLPYWIADYFHAATDMKKLNAQSEPPEGTFGLHYGPRTKDS